MARRLQKELKDFREKEADKYDVNIDGDNVMKWNVMFPGPKDSPYDGGVFNVQLDFPTDYPFKPPKVKFVTRVYHPNIRSKDGEICGDLLSSSWGPTLNVKHVLEVLTTMLKEPNASSPLEAEIGSQYTTDIEKFKKTAKEWTTKYAS